MSDLEHRERFVNTLYRRYYIDRINMRLKNIFKKLVGEW